MARFLKTNTAVRVTVGPFLDKSDGITPEVALTVTAEKLTFIVDDGGVPTLVLDTNPTASGGNNDMVHITGDEAGFYDLELTAANTNYVGRAMLCLNDVATHCPVWHEFMILNAEAYDSLILSQGVGMRADVRGWLGTVPATPATAGVPSADLITWRGAQPLTLTSQMIQSSTAAMQAGVVTASAVATGAIDADALSADAGTELANAVKAAVVETQGSITLQQALSVILSAVAGVTADAGATFKSPNGTSTRIAATTNASNERTSITLTPSA